MNGWQRRRSYVLFDGEGRKGGEGNEWGHEGWASCIGGGIRGTEGVGRSALAAMGMRRGVGGGKASVGVRWWMYECRGVLVGSKDAMCGVGFDLDCRGCWRGI